MRYSVCGPQEHRTKQKREGYVQRPNNVLRGNRKTPDNKERLARERERENIPGGSDQAPRLRHALKLSEPFRLYK